MNIEDFDLLDSCVSCGGECTKMSTEEVTECGTVDGLTWLDAGDLKAAGTVSRGTIYGTT